MWLIDILYCFVNPCTKVIEEEAILSEWQIGKDEEIEENYLEGTEIVIGKFKISPLDGDLQNNSISWSK